MHSNTFAGAALALVVLTLVAVSGATNSRSKRDAAANAAVTPREGPRPVVSNATRSSTRRAQQLSDAQTEPSCRVNVLGSPYISCPVNLPVSQTQALEVARQQQRQATLAAVELSNRLELVQVPSSAAVVLGNPFSSTPVQLNGDVAQQCIPTMVWAELMTQSRTRRASQIQQLAAAAVPILDVVQQDASGAHLPGKWLAIIPMELHQLQACSSSVAADVLARNMPVLNKLQHPLDLSPGAGHEMTQWCSGVVVGHAMSQAMWFCQCPATPPQTVGTFMQTFVLQQLSRKRLISNALVNGT